jgi:copper homeostasis protein
MPGSGINADNIKMIAEKTGAVEFHGALRNTIKSKMEFSHPSFSDNTNPWIDADEVQAMRKALNEVKLKEV